MATMQQQGAGERQVGVQPDRRTARLALVGLTIIAAAIGAAVVFTQSSAQRTTTRGIAETLRFPEGGPDSIVVGTDALWVGINPAFARALQSGQEAQSQKFGSLERVNLSGAVERTLRIPGFVGPSPLHLGNALWVTRNSDGMATKPGELDKLDWNTGNLLGRLPFPHGIHALAYGDGSLWVSVGASPATLVRVDPATVRPIGTPIVIAPGVAFGIAFGNGAMWETGFDDGSLARVNPATERIDRRIPLGGAAVGVVVSGGSVWVALRDRGTVIRVDPRTLHVLHTTPVGADPAYLVAAGGLIWVANQSDGTVTRIDARTGQTVGLPIRITPDDAGNLTTAGSSVWVTSILHSSATRIDLNQTR